MISRMSYLDCVAQARPHGKAWHARKTTSTTRITKLSKAPTKKFLAVEPENHLSSSLNTVSSFQDEHNAHALHAAVYAGLSSSFSTYAIREVSLFCDGVQ